MNAQKKMSERQSEVMHRMFQCLLQDDTLAAPATQQPSQQSSQQSSQQPSQQSRSVTTDMTYEDYDSPEEGAHGEDVRLFNISQLSLTRLPWRDCFVLRYVSVNKAYTCIHA